MAKANGKKEKKTREKDYEVNVETRQENTSLGTVDIDVNIVTFSKTGDVREFVASKAGREAMYAWLGDMRRKSSGRATKDDRLKSAVGLAYNNLYERITAYTAGDGTLPVDEARVLDTLQDLKKEMEMTFPVLARKPRKKKEKK